MSGLPLTLRLQGLWVGAALGELYASGYLSAAPPPSPLRAQTILPKTYRLCLSAARWLRGMGDVSAEVLHCSQWQDAFLNLLPLAFLDPQGSQSLKQVLIAQIYSPESLTPKQQEQGVGAITLIEILEWLQFSESARPGSDLERHLDNIHAQLQDARSLNQLPEETVESLSGWTPDSALTQILYLLLSSPEDFRLTVQRAAYLRISQPDLLILLAALSGFQNGVTNLPLSWRKVLTSVFWAVDKPLEESLLTFAALCAAQWAGEYQIQADPGWTRISAIALPGQLRPR